MSNLLDSTLVTMVSLHESISGFKLHTDSSFRMITNDALTHICLRTVYSIQSAKLMKLNCTPDMYWS